LALCNTRKQSAFYGVIGECDKFVLSAAGFVWDGRRLNPEHFLTDFSTGK
jgi:hypothetical protein